MNFATQNSKAFAPNDFSRFSDKFESGHRHHVVADVISFATTFFYKKRHRSFILSRLLSKSNPLMLGFDLELA